MKRDLNIWKETYIYGNRRTYMKCDAHKRPTYKKIDLHIWKETYIYEKRPTYMKRDLHIWK